MSSQYKLLIFLIFFLFLGISVQWYQHQFVDRSVTFSSLEIEDNTAIKNSYSKEVAHVTYRVHVAGAVHHPGVYDVATHLRVLDVLELAGGVLPGANLDKLNLAQKVKDGKQIFVKQGVDSNVSFKQYKAKISLNLASREQLISIPGIGPKTADLILSYKKEMGRFVSLDQLLNVKGIGKKTLEKLSIYLSI